LRYWHDWESKVLDRAHSIVSDWLPRLAIPQLQNAPCLRRDDFKKRSTRNGLGAGINSLSVALQEARPMAALGSADGALLADLAAVQSLSTLLLLAQLCV